MLHATGVLISSVCDESFSRDSRIADCTVRHPGVERPFSSFYMLMNFIEYLLRTKIKCALNLASMLVNSGPDNND